MNIFKIRWLKKQAQRLYNRLERAYDCVDCGASLAEYMCPSLRRDRKRLLAMVRLIKRYENG